jgi:TonB family protein
VPRARIRIVAGFGSRASALRSWVTGSLLVHVLGAAVLIWLPELRGGNRIPLDTTVVELVGALPGSRPQPTTAAPSQAVERQAPPEPEPEPEGARLEGPEPPVEKPPERKTETKAAPEPRDEQPPREPSGGPAAAEAGPEEGLSGMAGSAAGGASVSALDLGDAAFAWYRSAVTNALYSNWRRPVLSGMVEPVEVRVAFEIMRDGTVRGLRLDEPSGVPTLDRSALRAVSDAAPLPALPSSLHEPYLPASIVFRLYPEGH